MGISYGKKPHYITADLVDTVTITNCTTVSNGNDSNGRYALEVYHNTGGCGTTDHSAINILIKDFIPWTILIYDVYVSGSAACWSFNQGTSYNQGTHNILSFNSSLDPVYKAKNCWEYPQFALKMTACDNNSDNFFHGNFKVGSYASWTAVRRRDTNAAGLAGVAAGRSCNTTGTGSVTRISNIRVVL